jgi:hypothetical protein
MSNTVIALKSSGTASNVVNANNLVYGELAINYADGILYYKTASNTVGSIKTAQPGGLNTEIQFNDSGVFGGSSNFVYQKSNVRLGIGTSSPLGKLHIKSNAAAGAGGFSHLVVDQTLDSSQSRISLKSRFGSSSVTETEVAAIHLGTVTAGYVSGILSSDIRFDTINTGTLSERVRIKSDGNVGIGTTNPSYPLEIASPNSTSIAFQRTGVSAKKWGFDSDNDSLYIVNITDFSQRLTVTNDGKIGIGTIYPSTQLYVKTEGTSNTSVKTALTLENYPYAFDPASNGFGVGIEFRGKNPQGGSSIYGNIEGVYETRSGTHQGGALLFKTDGYIGDSTTRMIIDSVGNLGLGTTSPAAFTEFTTNRTVLQIKNSTSDSGQLILGGINALLVDYDNSTGNATIRNTYGSTSANALINIDSGTLVFRTSTSYTESVRITSAGNVGIGTTSPGSKLDVKGTLRLSGSNTGYVGITTAADAGSTTYTLPSTDGTNGYVLSTNGSGTLSWVSAAGASSYWVQTGNDIYYTTGSVGIGTTSPAAKMHVEDGDIILGNWGTYPGSGGSSNSTSSTTGKIKFALTYNDTTYDPAIELFRRNDWSASIGILPNKFVLASGHSFSFRTGATNASPGGTERIVIGNDGGMSFGTGVIDNKIYLYDNSTDKYGFGVRSSQFLIYSGAQGDPTGGITFGKFDGTTFTESVRITNSGNVGIGTTTLQNDTGYKTLSISGSTGGQIALQNAGTTRAWIYHNSTDLYMTNISNGPLVLGTNNGERMRITGAGDVGIGTNAPSLTGLAILSGGQGKGVLVARNATGSPTSGQSLGSYAFKGIMDGVNSNVAAEAMIEAVAAENQSGFTAATNLLFYTKPSGTGPGSSPTLRMTLDSSGNLGIGTSSPAGVLNIKTSNGQFLVQNGTSAAQMRISAFNNAGNANAALIFEGYAIEYGRFDASGNLGIGTTSPGAKLEVAVSGSSQQLRLVSTGNSIFRTRWIDATAGFALESNDTTETAYYPFTLTGSVFRFNTGAGNLAATLDSSGNLGIGTSSPVGKLQVSGANDSRVALINGATKGVRFNIGSSGSSIEGVDNTGAASFQPLTIGGSTITFSISGGDKALLDSSGNLGLGVTPKTDWSTDYKAMQFGASGALSSLTSTSLNFTVLATNQYINSAGTSKFINDGYAPRYLLRGDTGEHYWYTTNTSTAGQNVTNTQAMTLDASGNLGVGTTLQNERLRLNSSSNSQARMSISYADSTIAFFGSYSGIVGSGNATDVMLSATNVLAFGAGGTTERARITSGGDLLVGATSVPSPVANYRSLVVGGSTGGIVDIGTTSTSYGRVSADSVGLNVESLGATTTIFRTDATERARITSGGFFGIGTTSPTKRLEVKGTTTGSAIRASVTDGQGSSSFGYGFYIDNTQHEIAQILGNYVSSASSGYGGLTFNVANNGLFSAMTIEYTGKVGIGTTLPSTKLHISGDSVANEGLLKVENIYASGNTYYPTARFINTRGNHSYGVVAEFITNTAADTDRPSILFYGAQAAHSWQVGMGQANTNDFHIGYRASNTPSSFSAWPTSYLTVLTGGNVGIGTTSPSEKLQVNGNIKIPTGGVLYVENPAGGRLGYLTTNSTGTLLSAHNDAGEPLLLSAPASTAYMSFSIAGSERARITSGGNVGIGSSTPQYKLDVNSGLNSNSFSASFGSTHGIGVWSGIHFGYLETGNTNYRKSALIFERQDNAARGKIHILNNGADSGASATLADARLTILYDGKIGIATTSPSETLHVSGTIRVDGTTNGIRIFQNGSNSTNSHLYLANAANDRAYNWQLNSTGSGLDFWAYGGSAWMRHHTFLANGDVGIGTTSPSSRLHLYNTSGDVELRMTADSSYDPIFRMTGENNGTSEGFTISYDNSVGDVYFNSIYGVSTYAYHFQKGAWGSGTSLMVIQNDGKIGIGTASPGKKLTISRASETTSEQLELRSEGGISTGNYDGIVWTQGASGGTTLASIRVAYNSSGTPDMVFNLRNDNNVIFLKNGGNVGIGTNNPGYKLEVNGSFAATTKSFVIDHPTKEGMKLRYGSLEGPENGVYIRGRLKNNNTIELPEYWTKLVDADTITVQLTPIGKNQELYVEDILNNKVIIAGSENINCFYMILAERIDVEKLTVEYKEEN